MKHNSRSLLFQYTALRNAMLRSMPAEFCSLPHLGERLELCSKAHWQRRIVRHPALVSGRAPPFGPVVGTHVFDLPSSSIWPKQCVNDVPFNGIRDRRPLAEFCFLHVLYFNQKYLNSFLVRVIDRRCIFTLLIPCVIRVCDVESLRCCTTSWASGYYAGRTSPTNSVS